MPPRIIVSRRLSFGFLMLVAMFGVYLPLFGTSLIVVKLLEGAVLSRIPRVRDLARPQAAGPPMSRHRHRRDGKAPKRLRRSVDGVSLLGGPPAFVVGSSFILVF